MKTKTFSLIPYLIKLFKIQFIISSRASAFIHQPGDNEQKDTSVYDTLKEWIKYHPEKSLEFRKPENMNFIGETLYFIGIQFLGIAPIVIILFMGSLIIIFKTIQFGFILFFSIVMTVIFFMVKIYKTLTFKKQTIQKFTNYSINA